MTTVAEDQQVANLMQIAAEREQPEWCDHSCCEPVDDFDGVNTLYTRVFWASDDGDRRVEWMRADRHEADGVVKGAGEMWADVPLTAYGDDIEAYREGLSAAFRFIYELGQGKHA